MDNAAVSRRNYTNKKGNKENAQPAAGSTFSIKGEKISSSVPFQQKGNKKGETVAKNEPIKPKFKAVDTKKTARELHSQRAVKGAPATEVKRQTHSQVFLTELAVKHRKMVAEAPKPPAPAVKSAPGMYKGKIVQSKIGSIWKSTDSVATADPKPSVPKTKSQGVGNITRRNISKSVVEVPRSKMQKPALARSKSVTDRLPPASKPAASSRRPPATLTNASSRNATVAPIKASGNLSTKPKVAVTENKIKKPPVSNTLSQYRFNTETAKERRAKLAEWLASKGKTLKRPAMTAAVPSKTKVSVKTETHVKPQPDPEPQMAAQCELELDPSEEVEKLESPVPADCEDKVTELKSRIRTPGIMNTTLDLLESSDSDLLDDPQDRVDDIVVNLCDALEAMEPPSRCTEEDISEVTDECDGETDSRKSGDKCKEELKTEEQQPEDEQVKHEAKESSDHDDDEYVESDDDDVMETTPQISDASVIKYSVKTTPYLQSVKKTIEDEVGASASRRKSNIKDLKFLTPVRRSCRIQRKSSCLPMMLVDHDPCVSSLAELVKLDDDPNAYIYRKNPALLEDLPDQGSL